MPVLGGPIVVIGVTGTHWPAGTLRAVEGDRPDQPDWSRVIRLLKLVSDEGDRNMLFAWLQHVLDGMDTRDVVNQLWVAADAERVSGRLSVAQQDQMAEAYGTAYPATVDLQPATVRIEPGSVTVAPGAPPAPAPLAWRRDLFVAAVVVFVILSFADRSFTEGLADALRELCLILIALGLGYRQQ